MLIFFKHLFIIERQRDTECEQGRGRERGRHRIWSRLQALSCQHRAWCGARTHKLRDHDLSWSQKLNWLSHPGAPVNKYFSFWCNLVFFSLFFYCFIIIFLFWERETESEQGRHREGDTESEAGSRLWPVSTQPNAGLELTDYEIMTWAKVGRLTDWATQAPRKIILILKR